MQVWPEDLSFCVESEIRREVSRGKNINSPTQCWHIIVRYIHGQFIGLIFTLTQRIKTFRGLFTLEIFGSWQKCFTQYNASETKACLIHEKRNWKASLMHMNCTQLWICTSRCQGMKCSGYYVWENKRREKTFLIILSYQFLMCLLLNS